MIEIIVVKLFWALWELDSERRCLLPTVIISIIHNLTQAQWWILLSLSMNIVKIVLFKIRYTSCTVTTTENMMMMMMIWMWWLPSVWPMLQFLLFAFLHLTSRGQHRLIFAQSSVLVLFFFLISTIIARWLYYVLSFCCRGNFCTCKQWMTAAYFYSGLIILILTCLYLHKYNEICYCNHNFPVS